MKFNIRGYNRGFPRFVSAGMRRGACFALKNKNLLFRESEVSEHLISLSSPVPPLLLLSLLTRIIPAEDSPSSSFRLRIKRNPAPGFFFLSREKERKKEKHLVVGKISGEETKRKRRGKEDEERRRRGTRHARHTKRERGER